MQLHANDVYNLNETETDVQQANEKQTCNNAAMLNPRLLAQWRVIINGQKGSHAFTRPRHWEIHPCQGSIHCQTAVSPTRQ